MFSIKLLKNSSHVFKSCLKAHKIVNQVKYVTTFSYPKSQHKTQKLVIDLSFEDLMTSEECNRLAIDLYSIYSFNSCVPKEKQFDVSLCHQLSNNSLVIEYLRHYLPNLKSLDNFNVYNESYLSLFDPQRLVYLSPDARDLIEFDPNDIYIIGGIVQKKIFKRGSNRVTYSKAKEEGIRMGRFPIDHLTNRSMRRGIVLFLPQVFSILSDIKCGHSWEGASQRNIPYWKLKPSKYGSVCCEKAVLPK